MARDYRSNEWKYNDKVEREWREIRERKWQEKEGESIKRKW